MRTVRGKVFDGVRVKVDGIRFEACKFRNCEFVYRGGALPHLINSEVGDITFTFEGGAQRTIDWLRFLTLNGGGDQVASLFLLDKSNFN